MQFPVVSLAIDNCFASKRWTKPAEWMEVARDLGVACVEASADTEADPMYCGEPYMDDWANEVVRCGEATGVRVVNLYSGHGTYATLGLGHTDERVRQRLRDLWVKPMIQTAAKLHAGLGFYCHAFPESVLQDPGLYAAQQELLFEQLGQIATYAVDQGVSTIGIEQMYSPHQIPWTIDGARDFVAQAFRRSGAPIYLTIDTGHQTGQHRFLRPSAARIVARASEATARGDDGGLWLGPRRARERFEACVSRGGAVSDPDLAFMMAEMDRSPFLFSTPQDGDPYAWLEALGCFSPIVHLQQVTKAASAHLPFTAETNSQGIIHPEKVLRSILKSYERPHPDRLPRSTKEISLTLEIFSGTAETPAEIIAKLRASVSWWRRAVPQDGRRLDELVATLPRE